MKLEGIHHITAITENAQRNVDFYAGVMGLRLVKKTVNQDNPTVYHLFFADEAGDAGSDLTFFEYPGAPLGRAGAGMVHRIVWRVASEEALDFWAERLRADDTESERDGNGLVFSDPEGLEHELLVVDVPDQPLIADHPEVPAELALQGFHAVRAYSAAPEASERSARGARVRAGRRGLGSARREPRRPLRLRRAAGRARASGCGQRPPRRLGLDSGGAARLAREGGLRWRPADSGDRPLLLPLDLLPRAERRPLRDRDAGSRASPSTSRSSTSARSSRCRPTSSTCATRSNRSCVRSSTRASKPRVDGRLHLARRRPHGRLPPGRGGGRGRGAARARRRGVRAAEYGAGARRGRGAGRQRRCGFTRSRRGRFRPPQAR